MRKAILVAGLTGMTFLLSGCPTFDVGGWITSVNDQGANNKATFGGSFSCTPVYDYFGEGDDIYWGVIEGYFQYHDHAYQIGWKNKSRDLSFHGDFEQGIFVGQDDPEGLCELMDSDFVSFFGSPDGYCGPARLQPAPKTPNDDGYGQDLAYRIAVADGTDDEIWVWIGPANGGDCPINKDGTGPDDGSECAASDLCYENYGILGGGNVTVEMPLLP